MAVGQLASFEHMPRILAAYGLVTGPASTVLAAALIAGELVCGTWFLSRPRSKALAPVWVYTGVSVVWTVLAVQAYARGLAVDNCGCFGVYLTQHLSWVVLVQDAAALLYAALLFRSARRAPVPPGTDRQEEDRDRRRPGPRGPGSGAGPAPAGRGSRGGRRPRSGRPGREESCDGPDTRAEAQGGPGRGVRGVHQVDLPAVQDSRRCAGQHPREQGLPA
ncbi:MauE/DoxX family redox-associated membrane protein [Streptomyces sanyensis]|uniref:MauE/DoxX family redox-associated membrane protein n=1 Tax=Streptomyces sanyensis TaxID=568869 RepID=UPI003D77A2C9